MLKALGFNSLKVQCFQAIGFRYQPAPLHLGLRGGDHCAEYEVMTEILPEGEECVELVDSTLKKKVGMHNRLL